MSVFSQTRQLSSLKATADKEFKNKNFYGATQLYKDCMKYDPRQHELIWKAAESARLDNNYAEAVKYYKIICNKYSEKYPESYFYYAKMLKSDEKYLLAQYNFQAYLKQNKTLPELAEIAQQELIDCEFAWRMSFRPTGLKILHCDTLINSVYSEFAPAITKDGTLIFSSIRPNENQINNYESKIYVYNVEKPVLFDSTINQKNKDISNICFDASNTKCYFTMSDNDFTHIYFSKYNGKQWSTPKKLSNSINVSKTNATQPFLVELKDKNLLFWASDKKGGDGGFDIYFSEIQQDTIPIKVTNIGRPIIKDDLYRNFYDTVSVINSSGNEITPFYDIQDSTLYFSSDFYQSFGGYDIFSVKNLDGNFIKWGKIENLGYPLNSAQNDMYFKKFYNKDKNIAYFVSNRKSAYYEVNQSCCNDIYYFDIEKDVKIDTVKLEKIIVETLTDKITLLVPITLYFHNDYPTPNSWDTVTKKNYTDLYFDYMKLQEPYRVFYSKGLSRQEKFAAIDSIDAYFIDNVQFNYEKLLEFTNLMKELLVKGQKIEITIKGYTSPLNTVEYNNNLAKRRISSLVNYFAEYNHGSFVPFIESGQIDYKFVAFGKTLSAGKVSDDPKDPRNSIYSPAASRERRIEIIAVSVEKND